MTESIIGQYASAKARLAEIGYAGEVEWQAGIAGQEFTEPDLLREAAWVILCSGFREKVVRQRFEFISLCYCDWESAEAILANEECCIRTAASVFGNRRKLRAIADVARRIQSTGFQSLRRRIQENPIRELSAFPYVGPVTAYHLAKNLGFPVAKNDRHLQRLAIENGFANAHELCEYVSQATGDPVPVVDIVLWRTSVLGFCHPASNTFAVNAKSWKPSQERPATRARSTVPPGMEERSGIVAVSDAEVGCPVPM